MSENNHVPSRARQILNLLYGSKWARIVPVLTAAAAYLLFLIFGVTEDKVFLLIASPVMSLIAFAGMYGLLWFQTKNPSCTEEFLNMGMLLFTAVFGGSAISLLATFLRSMQQGYTMMLPMTLVIWSAISLAHSKRSN